MYRPSLNHAYRLVWSDVTQSYVAVAEHTKSRGKRKALAAAIALTLLPALAGAASIGNQSPNGYATTSGSSHTVLIGSHVEHTSAGTALEIDPGGMQNPYGSTFINRGTIESLGDLDQNTQINAYGVHFGSADGQSDLTGSIINQADAKILVDVSQNYKDIVVGEDGTTEETIAANALANGYGLSLGNVLGTITNHGEIDVWVANETNNASAVGLQAGGIGEDGKINNSVTGSIRAFAGSYDNASAKGIELNGNVDGAIVNAGNIGAQADGRISQALGIHVFPDGDGALGDLNANLTNAASGHIQAISSAFEASSSISGDFNHAAGILILGNVSEGVTLTNDGTIEAGASASGATFYGDMTVAEGIAVNGALNGTIVTGANSSITAVAMQQYGYGTASATAINIEGGMSASGSLINHGSLSAMAAQGEDGDANAAAIHISGEDSGAAITLTNSGTINAHAQTLWGTADATGIQTEYIGSGTITNNGNINASAAGLNNAYATGIDVLVDGFGGNTSFSGTIENGPGAVITATADGKDYADAVGIYLDGYEGNVSFSGAITNGLGSSINVTAMGEDAYAEGIHVGGDVASNGTITNQGSITVLADASLGEDSYSAEAHGIYVSGDLAGKLTNNGMIDVTAKTGNGGYDDGAEAIGIEVDDDLLAGGELTNNGLITVTASTVGSNAEATGILIDDDLGEGATLTNNGGIVASASVSGFAFDDVSATAYGIEVDDSMHGALITGEDSSITAYAWQGSGFGTASAIGIHLDEDMSASSVLNNAGDITATAAHADGGEGYAAGIRINDGSMAGTLINSGEIFASSSVSGSDVMGMPLAAADGIYIEGALTGTLTNNGLIKAEATTSNFEGKGNAQAYGVNVESIVGEDGGNFINTFAYGPTNGSLTNNNAIVATAVSAAGLANAAGIITEQIDSGKVTNNGSITANAQGLIKATAHGIYVSGYIDSVDANGEVTAFGGDISGDIVNGEDGVITAVASNNGYAQRIIDDGSSSSYAIGNLAYAAGIGANGSLSGSLINSGMIQAEAYNSFEDGDAIANAIDIRGSINVLTNEGTLSAKAITGTGEDITQSNNAEATGIKIGGIAQYGELANGVNGQIIATAIANDDDAEAVGIDVRGDMLGSLTNKGLIKAIATGKDDAEATGIRIDRFEGQASFSGTLTNDLGATIVATATGEEADATGIYLYGDVTSHSSIINKGSISVTADATLAGEDASSAEAYGIYVDGSLAGKLVNSGTIDVTAKIADGDEDGAEATGILIEGAVLAGAELVNNKAITVTATATDDYAEAIGIDVDDYNDGGFSGKLVNAAAATIKVTADAYDEANAKGINIEIDGYEGGSSFSGTLTNAGKILVSATSNDDGAYASGINIEIDGYEGNSNFSGTLTNSGKIDVSAVSDDGYANAIGIDIGIDGYEGSGSFSGTLINALGGSIIANATGKEADAAGIYLYGDVASNGTITNNGSIVVTADASLGEDSYSAEAHGIYVDGAFAGKLANNGSIDVTAKLGGGYNDGVEATGITIDGEVLAGAEIVNTKTIKVTANASYDHVQAAGILIDGYEGSSFSGSLTNAVGAEINVAATGEDAGAAGIYVYGNVASSGQIVNSGTIKAVADTVNGQAHAAGIVIGGIDSQSLFPFFVPQTPVSIAEPALVNEGTIAATATGGYANAYGVAINGIAAQGSSIVNSGTIIAKATGSGSYNAYAAGIEVDTLNGAIINSGKISGVTNSEFANGYSINAHDGTGSIINKAGALLQGNLNAGGSINVDNAGTIALTEADGGEGYIAHGEIGGNYTQSSTGVLKIGAYGTGNSNSSLASNSIVAFGMPTVREYSTLTVAGDVNIAGKAFVDVRTGNTGPTKLAVGQKLDNVVTVGGELIGSGFTAVDDNSLLFNFVNRVDEDGNIDFDIVKGSTVTQSADNRSNRAGRGAAVVFDKIIDGGLAQGDMQNVINALGQLGSDKEVSDAVTQTTPLVSGQGSQSIMGGLNSVNRIVQARQEGQHGRSSGDSFLGDNKFWFKSFGSRADQNSRDGAIGYDATSYGMVFGADAVLSDVNRIGLAFSYAKTDVDGNSDVARQKADVDSYNVVMYGSHSLTDATDLSFQADVGYHKTDGSRRIVFGGLTRTADASYDSWSTHLGVGLAHTMKLSELTSFTPSVRADYTYIKADSYRESGAGALNLNVGSSTAEALVLGVDGKVAHAVTEKATLVANLGVGYDALNERSSVTSTFAGDQSATKFVTKGVDPSPWLTRGGFGIVGKITDTTEITARYDFEVRDDFTNQTASVKLRWAF